jgi:hypothetical protein
MALPIGLVQMRCTEAPRENLERALGRAEEAARSGARVVCLQELFRSPYPCQSEDPERFSLAEPVPGPTTEAFVRELHFRETVRLLVTDEAMEEQAPHAAGARDRGSPTAVRSFLSSVSNGMRVPSPCCASFCRAETSSASPAGTCCWASVLSTASRSRSPAAPLFSPCFPPSIRSIIDELRMLRTV